MTGRCELVSAATALQWGLADAVAPADDLDAELHAFVAPFLDQTATALRGCKALARAARRGESYEALRAIEQSYFVQTWTAPPHWQAVERILARSSDT
jgi:enoyl-CoA hydratase/carnithine racemase